MELAIKDKTAQLEQKTAAENNKNDDLDDDDDPQLQAILQKMKDQQLKAVKKARDDDDDDYTDKPKDKENVWYGEYQDIVEDEFLPYVTKADSSVCHFYHNDFERCKIIDKHLQILAPKHKECKFLKLNAEKSPFFVNKLQVKVLPTICLFKKGVLVDKIVGFEDLGGKDDFKTIDLVRKYTLLSI